MKGKLACSFCGSPDHEVNRLIAGPKVFICDSCVGICNEILAKHPPASEAPLEARAPLTSRRRRLLEFLRRGRRNSSHDFAGSGPALMRPR
jgi:hypothetical protein